MRARIFRLCTALFVSVAAWLHQPTTTVSCGPIYDGEDKHITCFDPSVLPDSLYQGYFRLAIGTASWMTSEDEFNWREDSAAPAPDRNITEWGAYLGGRVPLRDIETFVYADSVEGVKRLLERARRGGAVDTGLGLRGMETARELVRRRDTAMIRYMIFAKECEPYMVENSDEWGAVSRNPSVLPLLTRGRAEHAACRNRTLRLRYGYQLVRLAHYNGWYREALDLFDSTVAPVRAESIIYYAALQHRAGAFRRTGRTAEAMYALSIVFEHAPERRWSTLFEFRPPGQEAWDSAYALARTGRERSTLWMMRGLKEYRLNVDPMAAMVKLTPRDPRIDVMLLREVREVERRLYSERATRRARLGRPPKGHGSARLRLSEDEIWNWAEQWTDESDDPRYPARLARFVESCADRRLVASPALWYAVAGYLRIMSPSSAAARRDLDRAERLAGENRDLAMQIRVLRMLLRSRSGSRFSVDISGEYTAALSWIERYQSPMRPHVPALMLLGQKLLRQGDVPRAAAAFARGGNTTAMAAVLDIYATDADLVRLQRLLERRSRPLDTFLFDRFPLSAGQVLDVRATRMMRRGRFADAVRLWDQLDRRPLRRSNLADTLTADSIASAGAFNAVIDTTLPRGVEWRRVSASRETTRPAFARRMLELERRARRSRADGERYRLAIARALRSSPFWGYSSQLWDGSLIIALRYFYGPTDYPFNMPGVARRMAASQVTFLREYGSNELAVRYFNRVRRATRDRELAARCLYEADEALKNPQTSYHQVPDRQDRTGYDLLRTRYRRTAFAQEILTNCGTYEWFTAHR